MKTVFVLHLKDVIAIIFLLILALIGLASFVVNALGRLKHKGKK